MLEILDRFLPYTGNLFVSKEFLVILITINVFIRYIVHLKSRGIEVARHAEYIKWLRFYFEFCDKYPVPEDPDQGRVRTPAVVTL